MPAVDDRGLRARDGGPRPGQPGVPARPDRGGHQGVQRHRPRRAQELGAPARSASSGSPTGTVCAPIAASTHPFAHWLDQQITPTRNATTTLARELQATARRLLICGMHVHVGIDDDELRIDLMNQFSVLPAAPAGAVLLIALLGRGEHRPEVLPPDGVRCAAAHRHARDASPATAEYERHIEMLVGAGLIEDGTKIWWDVRPSARYPDPGNARHGRVHAHRRRGVHCRHQRLPAAHAVPPAALATSAGAPMRACC